MFICFIYSSVYLLIPNSEFIPPSHLSPSVQFSRSVMSDSLLKFMSIESVMLSKHLILCHPLLLLPSIFPSIRVFANDLALCIRWPKYWNFSFSIGPSSEYSGLISSRIDGFLGPRDTDLQSRRFSRAFSSTRIQKHQFFSAQSFLGPTLTSVHDHWKNHSFNYTDLCWQSDISAFQYTVLVRHSFSSKD